MSRYTYVADSKAIIAVQGLRTVIRMDVSKYGTQEFYYRLNLEYKGLSQEITYEDKEERDKTFLILSELLSNSPSNG